MSALIFYNMYAVQVLMHMLVSPLFSMPACSPPTPPYTFCITTDHFAPHPIGYMELYPGDYMAARGGPRHFNPNYSEPEFNSNTTNTDSNAISNLTPTRPYVQPLPQLRPFVQLLVPLLRTTYESQILVLPPTSVDVRKARPTYAKFVPT